MYRKEYGLYTLGAKEMLAREKKVTIPLGIAVCKLYVGLVLLSAKGYRHECIRLPETLLSEKP